MDKNYNMIIDITEPCFYEDPLGDAIESCICIKDFSVGVIVPDTNSIKSVLDELYELVKDSEYTASEFVSPKKDRVSFINGSYIDVKITNNKEGVIDG